MGRGAARQESKDALGGQRAETFGEGIPGKGDSRRVYTGPDWSPGGGEARGGASGAVRTPSPLC